MLKIEVIKFEAQDVITASTATCICGPNDGELHSKNGTHSPCPAEEHPDCYYIA